MRIILDQKENIIKLNYFVLKIDQKNRVFFVIIMKEKFISASILLFVFYFNIIGC